MEGCFKSLSYHNDLWSIVHLYIYTLKLHAEGAIRKNMPKEAGTV